MRRLFIAALAFLALAPLPCLAQAIGGWNKNASAVAGTATATHTLLNSSAQDVIYGVDGSCGATPTGPVLLQVKDGSTVVWAGYFATATFAREFLAGLAITPGNNSSAVLASCGSGITGEVNLHGATR